MQQLKEAKPRKRGVESEKPDHRIQRPSCTKPNQEPTMNRYQASLPRAAISIAAVAMTAVTLGLAILPAQVGKDGRLVVPAVDVAQGNVPPVEVAAARGTPLVGTPIVVYGYREDTGLRKVHMPHVTPPQKQRI
jgi:hypothetical protein